MENVYSTLCFAMNDPLLPWSCSTLFAKNRQKEVLGYTLRPKKIEIAISSKNYFVFTSYQYWYTWEWKIGNYPVKLLQSSHCDFTRSISTPSCMNYSSRNRPYKNLKKSGHESRSPVVTEKSSLKSVCFI